MSLINKDMFKDTSNYSMKWELQELQEIIKTKKNEVEDLIVEEYTKVVIQLRDKNELSDREIKSILKDMMKEIRQTEREV